VNQISNYVYLDSLFENIEIENKILPNPYKDYPYMVIKDFVSPSFSLNIIKTITSSKDYVNAKIKKEDNFGLIESQIDKEIRVTLLLVGSLYLTICLIKRGKI
jgi:SM-20-related protein